MEKFKSFSEMPFSLIKEIFNDEDLSFFTKMDGFKMIKKESQTMPVFEAIWDKAEENLAKAGDSPTPNTIKLAEVAVAAKKWLDDNYNLPKELQATEEIETIEELEIPLADDSTEQEVETTEESTEESTEKSATDEVESFYLAEITDELMTNSANVAFGIGTILQLAAYAEIPNTNILPKHLQDVINVCRKMQETK